MPVWHTNSIFDRNDVDRTDVDGFCALHKTVAVLKNAINKIIFDRKSVDETAIFLINHFSIEKVSTKTMSTKTMSIDSRPTLKNQI